MSAGVCQAIALLVAATALGGCASWKRGDGRRYTVVLGIGVMREEIVEPDGPLVTDLVGAGLIAHGLGERASATAGIYHGHSVRIPPKWKGTLSVETVPRKTQTIESH